jgi:hypothetical protein
MIQPSLYYFTNTKQYMLMGSEGRYNEIRAFDNAHGSIFCTNQVPKAELLT